MSGRKNGSNHKDFNIARLDSKGRLIIPSHIREFMNLQEGSEFLVVNNENREIRIFPLIKGQIAYFKVIISDRPMSLSNMLNDITKHSIDIVASSSKTMERGKTAEWTAITDVSMCKSIAAVKKMLESNENVKKVDINTE